LRNDDFLDKLADTLDGIEVSESEESSDSEEASASAKSDDEEEQSEVDEQQNPLDAVDDQPAPPKASE